jgi:hypothetical protein
LTLDQAEDPAFWLALAPDLTLGGEDAAPRFTLDAEEMFERLRVEGYVNVPDVVPPELVRRLHACIRTLHERHIPLVFAYVYDEMWRLFQGAAPYLERALGVGYRAMPDFWAWYVLNQDGKAGWGPHRDRADPPTIDVDGAPFSLTVWMALSDATPLNGCMYVIPAHHDPCFEERVFAENGKTKNRVNDPQSARALPATAGSLLSWNQCVLHWGGRASRLGAAPRCSAAFEFQRGDKPPYNRPLLDPRRLPSLAQRLGLIGKQVLQYEHMYPLAPEVAGLAAQLRNVYLPTLR